MNQLEWHPDEATNYWAQRISLPASLKKSNQFSGDDKKMVVANWQHHITTSQFPDFCLTEDKTYLIPRTPSIIQCFREGYFLEGLVLTIGWGGMARAQKTIYGVSPDLNKMQSLLEAAYTSRAQAIDLQSAWTILTKDLGWGRVIASKVLHFLARSCGYEQNPPVPFDNAVSWNQLNSWFFTTISLHWQKKDPAIPDTWWDEENSWESYNRYMTAIICWAEQRGWTTTDIDASVFAKLSWMANSAPKVPETEK